MSETRASAPTARLSPRRIGAALGWGVIATIVMSLLMGVATASGVSPMPEPIPAALTARTVGELAPPLLLGLAVVAHLAYGGLGAVVLAALVRRITLMIGLLWGAALWLVAGVAWLPYVGWGPFGAEQAVSIAVATLVLHLVYGGVLGWLASRARVTS